MDRVEEIESAIDRLPPEDYKRVLAWFREDEQSRWDEQMDRDSSEGRLDFLFTEAEGESAADVKSVASRRFRGCFTQLPADDQKLAVKNYELWRQDPYHPSLRFRRLKGNADRFTVRAGDRYRALGRVTAVDKPT
jgi:hypothetical protein